jgi:hypothetical protein|tara:strand:+ start:104 stop:265 length:162 start_codon:yes stop_codon:yes gene_type:complete
MNEILEEIDFLKNLSSELTMLTIKLAKINGLVTTKAVKSMEKVKKFEKEMKND